MKTKIKLLSAVPQRWVSTNKAWKRSLEIWKELEDSWYDLKREIMLPLKDKKDLLQELYSLMDPLANLITEVQGISTATGPLGLYLLMSLRTGYLKEGSPVEIIDPARERRAFENKE